MPDKINYKIILLILLINLLMRLFVAFQPLELLDYFIPDDTFLSLKIAKNISEGLGPLYGTAPTNGFQPLFVFLMSPVYTLFPDDLITPLRVSLVFNSIFDTISLYMITFLIFHFAKSKMLSYLISIFWIVNSYIISTTMNGLETVLSFMLLLTVIFYSVKKGFFEQNKIRGYEYFIFGLLSGIAAFARIDNLIPIFFIYIFNSYNLVFKNKNLLEFFNSSVLILSGLLITYSPWLIYSYNHTGLLYQISGKAVRFQTTYHINDFDSALNYLFKNTRHAASSILKSNLSIILMLIASLAIIIYNKLFYKLLQDLYKEKFILFILIYSLIFVGIYIIYVPATWFFVRYFFPVILGLFLLLAVFLNKILNESNKAIIYFLITIFLLIESYSFINKGIFIINPKNEMGYIEIGKWVNSNIKEKTIIGCSQTGAIGYFAENHTVINLDGVVNAECYKSLINQTNIEYIRSENIQYVIGWDINIRFIERNSKNYKSNDLIKIAEIPNIQSWGNFWSIYRVNYD